MMYCAFCLLLFFSFLHRRFFLPIFFLVVAAAGRAQHHLVPSASCDCDGLMSCAISVRQKDNQFSRFSHCMTRVVKIVTISYSFSSFFLFSY